MSLALRSPRQSGPGAAIKGTKVSDGGAKLRLVFFEGMRSNLVSNGCHDCLG